MNILNNLNENIKYIKEHSNKQPMMSEEELRSKFKKYIECEFPQEYIDFLNETNGALFEITQMKNNKISTKDVDFYSMQEMLNFFDDSLRYELLESRDMIPIGDDMGCFTLFYGNVNEGFGIYSAFTSSIEYDDDFTYKVCNSIKELLVDGIGINDLFGTRKQPR